MFDFVLPILYFMFLISLFGFIFCFIYFLYYMKETNRRKKHGIILEKKHGIILEKKHGTTNKVKNNYKINAAFTTDEENFLLISSNKITRELLEKEYEVNIYDN